MECCICFDEVVDNIAFKCQRCKRGIVCTDCFLFKSGESKCPLCRFVNIEIKPPEIYIDIESQRKPCCRLKIKHCIVSTCLTIITGFILQLTFNAIVNDIFTNVIDIIGALRNVCCALFFGNQLRLSRIPNTLCLLCHT